MPQATAKLSAGDQFVFYLHGHARTDRAYLLGYELSATQLRDLLATIPAGVQQIIILDTCYAGSFLNELAGVAHRVVVTSTDAQSLTWQVVNSSFANQFMQSLEHGMSLVKLKYGPQPNKVCNTPGTESKLKLIRIFRILEFSE